MESVRDCNAGNVADLPSTDPFFFQLFDAGNMRSCMSAVHMYLLLSCTSYRVVCRYIEQLKSPVLRILDSNFACAESNCYRRMQYFFVAVGSCVPEGQFQVSNSGAFAAIVLAHPLL